MASNAPLQPCLLSSFLGERVAYSAASSLQLLRPRAPPSTKDAHLRVSRTFSSLTDFLFSRRNQPNIEKSKHKCLQPGNVSPRLHVPSHIPRPPYVNSRLSPGIASGPEVHDERGIECMRASGKLAAQVLLRAGSLVKPGITTDEIDQAVHQMIIDHGAYPSPLGYGGFPKSVCTSVNECICHGIPDSRALEDGDIINIDVTVYFNGYHGDTSATFFCGDVDDEAKSLVQVNYFLANIMLSKRDCIENIVRINHNKLQFLKCCVCWWICISSFQLVVPSVFI
ncbi:hypothetical protein Taro_003684 [Colocasia esculenta]|uniref:Peptidase M24 domain-containing protein n=1 Tax=Colocasia esculenta TaxID=4460 RepID=A0A843TSL3_COLES|nr:hypothetical protein [Colocasia esculenta]